MIISGTFRNKKLPAWVKTKEDKLRYYSEGRVTVRRLDLLNRKTSDFETKFTPRIAGMTFKPLRKKFCATAEEAFQEGIKLKKAMKRQIAISKGASRGKA
jgi:hypothetical protein